MLYKKQWHSWFHSRWVQNKGRSLQGNIYKHVDTTIIMQFPQQRNKHCWRKMFTQCQNCCLLLITQVLKFFVYGIQCCNWCNLRSSEIEAYLQPCFTHLLHTTFRCRFPDLWFTAKPSSKQPHPTEAQWSGEKPNWTKLYLTIPKLRP